MTDPAKFSRQEKEKQGTEENAERKASEKLEENLKKDDESGKPKGPEDAKRKHEDDEDPY
jgi:hypothetical protein